MQYREIHPPAHLRNIIRFFWTLEVDTVSSNAAGFRIVPDGCPGMMFWEENPQLSLVAGESSAVPHLFLYGQTTRHGMLYSPDRADPLGVSFYPRALKIVFGFDADEFRDEIIDLNLIQPGLAEKLYNSRQTKKRIDLLSSFISRQIAKHTSTDWFILNSIGRIIDSKGNIPIQNLYQKMQLSERQFQRRFKQQVGLTPKLFSRIIRFQSAFSQVRTRNYQQLSDVAFDNGYADQSHFIRDFKEFAGLNPGAYETRQISFICQHREWDMAFS